MWILDNEYNPALLAFLGAFVCLAVFVAWIKTGRKEVLYALAVAAVVAIGLIVAERMHVSDREAIEAKLVRIAQHLETNSREAVYDAIHPSAADKRAVAESELPKYTFTECRITKIHSTKVTADAQPKTAEVEFNIIATGSFRSGSDVFPEAHVPRYVKLWLKQDSDGEWKIVDYVHDSPERSLMQSPENFGEKMP
jgi:hypothetical protein